MRLKISGLCALALVGLVVGVTFAGKGGGKKPPKDEPPPDPAIAWIDQGGSRWNLGVMNDDGSNKVTLLSANEIGVPTWSPDGTQLAFASDVQGPGLYTVNVSGTGLTKLVVLNDFGSDAPVVAWAPAIVTDALGNRYEFAVQMATYNGTTTRDDVFLLDADDGNLVNLTNFPGLEGARTMDWSPTADRLVLSIMEGDGTGEVIVCGLGSDENGLIAITDRFYLTEDFDVSGGPINSDAVTSAAWAKTKDQIAVGVSYRDGSDRMPDIWLIDITVATAPTFTQITDTPDSEEDPKSWSSDDSGMLIWAGDRKTKGRPGGLVNTGHYRIPATGGERTLVDPDVRVAAWKR